jgi:hypothetical protein
MNHCPFFSLFLQPSCFSLLWTHHHQCLFFHRQERAGAAAQCSSSEATTSRQIPQQLVLLYTSSTPSSTRKQHTLSPTGSSASDYRLSQRSSWLSSLLGQEHRRRTAGLLVEHLAATRTGGGEGNEQRLGGPVQSGGHWLPRRAASARARSPEHERAAPRLHGRATPGAGAGAGRGGGEGRGAARRRRGERGGATERSRGGRRARRPQP